MSKGYKYFMVFDTQVLLPGQALISLKTFDHDIGSFGNILYSASYITNSRGLNLLARVEDDYSVFDFTYYLAREASIKELINNQARVSKNGCVTAGFSPAEFSSLERFFKSHKEKLSCPNTIYQVSLRGGRINYI